MKKKASKEIRIKRLEAKVKVLMRVTKRLCDEISRHNDDSNSHLIVMD